MANPRQRRKARSGTAKVKQSRRQQTKLKKVIVTGPEILRKEWNVQLTARQNLEKLGLARRPLALKHSGGSEKYLSEASSSQLPLEGNESDSDDAYASNDEDGDEQDMQQGDGGDSDEDETGGTSAPLAGPSSKEPNMSRKSKDIPKGFARIIRDENGNAIDVIMSAYDEPPQDNEQEDEDEGDEPHNASDSNGGKAVAGSAFQEEATDTPWGRPFAHKEQERKLRKAAKPVPAKTAALRELELRSLEERKTTAESQRFASPAEQQYLMRLAQKHGDDIQAMAKDFKLNKDQRTAGQLKKAFARSGGIEAFLAAVPAS